MGEQQKHKVSQCEYKEIRYMYDITAENFGLSFKKPCGGVTKKENGIAGQQPNIEPVQRLIL